MSEQVQHGSVQVRRRRARVSLAAAAAIGLLSAGACSSPTDSSSPTTRAIATPNLKLASALLSFDSCDAVLKNVKDEAAKRLTPYGLQTVGSATSSGAPDEVMRVEPGRRPAPSTSAAPTAPPRAGAEGGAAKADSQSNEAPASADSPAAGAGAPAPAHSTTNVQEAGVDEPDLVKTDGKRLFALLGGTLRSFNIVDGNPRPAGELNLSGSSGSGGQQLLLSGDRLLVLTKGVTTTGGPGRPAMVEDDVEPGATAPRVGTQLIEVDASDLANMKQTSQITIDGNVVDARLVANTARVVIESSPGALEFVQPRSSSKKATEAAKAANQRILDDSSSSDWLPQYSIAGSRERRPLVECANVSHPQQFSGFGMVTVLTVELGKGINPRNSVSVQADADKVYATTDRLFVSTNRAPEMPTGSAESSSGGARTEAPVTTVPDTGINCDPACPPPEPIPPRTTPRQNPTMTTSIHEFDITGNGPALYRASGEVRGHLFNDFAMSSRDGFLRVATTDSSSRNIRGTESYVSVLHEEDGELKVVGQVGGMGKGEQIKSVRFIDSIGYVVTFRQTDPLYTIDLANPRDPKVAGELKILGYSAYLHPVAPGRLLGVGQDATSTGRQLGTQVALFDVSNPAAPAQLQKLTLPGASSDAEQDYHAFLWWDPTKLALIPVQGSGISATPVEESCPPDARCTTTGQTSTAPFVGAIGFTVDSNGISELGRIQNPSSTQPSTTCPPGARCVPEGDPQVPGPTVVTTVPADPEAREACRAAGACPDDATSTDAGPAGPGAPSPSTTVVCVTVPCPGDDPEPPTTTSTTSVPSTTSSSVTTTTSTASPTTTTPTSTTSTTTKPSNGCDPLCPMPPIGGAGSPIERAVVVGDRVYTVSTTGIVVNELGSLRSLGWVPFT